MVTFECQLQQILTRIENLVTNNGFKSSKPKTQCVCIFASCASNTIMKLEKKAKIRNRYDQVPHLAQDTILESDKIIRIHHTQDIQEISPFPAGDHKAAMNRQDSVIKNQ